MVNKQEFLETYNYFDKDTLVEIIDIFLSEYEGRIQKIYTDVREHNFKDLRFDAHGIKGVIANFCAPVPWQVARDLEFSATSFIENNGADFSESKVMEAVDTLRDYVAKMAVDLEEVKAQL
jgi:HPt (histidine-containing phosphotransfer) domain-containing protein